jgi:hypothetical protein
MPRVRRHFYGACAIFLGGWEALAYRGCLPTITCFVQRRKVHKLVAFFWLLGLARHLAVGEKP